jgi:hypothetical protein
MAVVIVAWEKETISRRDANKLLGETLIYSHFPRYRMQRYFQSQQPTENECFFETASQMPSRFWPGGPTIGICLESFASPRE